MAEQKEEWWFGYECYGPCLWEGGGMVLDLRIRCDEDAEAPVVNCPCCGTLLDFKAMWQADEGGYGSRGDTASSACPKEPFGGQ